MQRPTRTVRVVRLDAQCSVTIGQVIDESRHVTAKLGNRCDAGVFQLVAANLPFSTPHIAVAAPKIVQEIFVAFFLDLRDLIVETKHNLTFAKLERLSFSGLPPLRIFVGHTEEVGIAKIDFRHMEIEGDIRAPHYFGPSHSRSQLAVPFGKAGVERTHAIAP